MKLTELIDLAGESLAWHPLMVNVTDVTTSKRGGNLVTFITPFVSPADAVSPESSQYVPIVIYLPRDKLPEEYR